MKQLTLTFVIVLLLTSCTPNTGLSPSSDGVTEIELATTEVTLAPKTTLTQEAIIEVTSSAPETIAPPMIHMLSKDDDYNTIIIDMNGELALDQPFTSGEYLPGTSFATMVIEDHYALIDLRDLSIFPAEDSNTLNALIADHVYHSSIVPFVDAETNLYGYKKNAQLLLPPIYTAASHFIDGYAVVLEGQIYDGKTTIIDEDLEPHYTNDLPIIALGEGLFGQVFDFYMYNNWYNKFILIDAEGNPLTEKPVFDPIVISDDLILVGDHLSHWYIDNSGRQLSTVTNDLLSLPVNEVIHWTGDYYLTINDLYNYDGLSIYNANGDFLFTSKELNPAGVDLLRDDLYVETHTLVQEKFTTITIPQLVSINQPNLFEQFNQQLMADHHDLYEPEPVEMVTMETETSFDYEIHGNILDINFYYYWYGFGAAHPNHFQETLHVDLTTGGSYTANDLSDDKSFYQLLTELVQHQAQENDPEAYWSIDDIIVDESTEYRHTDQGLLIYYSPYEISAYAFGYPEFLITYKALEGTIDIESPYYKALMAEDN